MLKRRESELERRIAKPKISLASRDVSIWHQINVSLRLLVILISVFDNPEYSPLDSYISPDQAKEATLQLFLFAITIISSCTNHQADGQPCKSHDTYQLCSRLQALGFSMICFVLHSICALNEDPVNPS